MTIDEAEEILKKKLAHITRDYTPEDQALDVLLKAAKKSKYSYDPGQSYHDCMDYLKDSADAAAEGNCYDE